MAESGCCGDDGWEAQYGGVIVDSSFRIYGMLVLCSAVMVLRRWGWCEGRKH